MTIEEKLSIYLRIDYKSISYHKQKRGKGEKRGREKEGEERKGEEKGKRGGGGFGLLHVLHSQIMFHTSGPMRSSKDFID